MKNIKGIYSKFYFYTKNTYNCDKKKYIILYKYGS